MTHPAYAWQPTHPDAQNDWSVPKATLGGEIEPGRGNCDVMRIRKVDGGPLDQLWEWGFQKVVAIEGGRKMTSDLAHCSTAKEAREACERAYLSA